MATVQDRKAPAAGTKVTAGQDAPVTREGAGFVAPESLAAESYEQNEGFATNRDARPDRASSQRAAGASNYTTGVGSDHPGTAAQEQTPQGGTAPSYVTAQYHSDPHGPHGKNLSQDGFDDVRLKDGLKMALDSEPGSADDPSRLAEAQFLRNEATQPGGTGQREGSLDTSTAYQHLDRETSS